MELTSGVLPREVYLRALAGIVEFLHRAGVAELLVAFGFGCDCPDDQLYQDVLIPLDRLLPFIAEAEAADYYRAAKDNLHVKDVAGTLELLFCHESDIHFLSADKELLERLKATWLACGFCKMFAHLGSEWQAVNVAGPEDRA